MGKNVYTQDGAICILWFKMVSMNQFMCSHRLNAAQPCLFWNIKCLAVTTQEFCPPRGGIVQTRSTCFCIAKLIN